MCSRESERKRVKQVCRGRYGRGRRARSREGAGDGWGDVVKQVRGRVKGTQVGDGGERGYQGDGGGVESEGGSSVRATAGETPSLLLRLPHSTPVLGNCFRKLLRVKRALNRYDNRCLTIDCHSASVYN